MNPRNIYADLCNAIKDESLSTDERNKQVKIAIETMIAMELSFDVNNEDGIADKKEEATPLGYAVEKGHTDIVKMLLEAKADAIKGHKKNRIPPLKLAIDSEQPNQDIVKLLLAAKADPNGGDEKTGFTHLMVASQNDDIGIVNALLDSKADPNKKDEEGDTALIMASSFGHTMSVTALLKAKADPNHVCKQDGETPVSLATKRGHTTTAKLLLTAKADPNKENKKGFAPLMSASHQGNTDLLQLLLAAKADPNKKEANGYTALMLAIKAGHTATSEELVAAGANMDIMRNEKSSLSYAIESRSLAIILLLLQHNAKIVDFAVLRNFLYAQTQNDPCIIECFRMMHRFEAIQREKLYSFNNAYLIYCSCFLKEIPLSKTIRKLVLTYDGRFFQSPGLPPINISKPDTIPPHFEEFKNEMKVTTKTNPHIFETYDIQEIEQALESLVDVPCITRTIGM